MDNDRNQSKTISRDHEEALKKSEECDDEDDEEVEESDSEIDELGKEVEQVIKLVIFVDHKIVSVLD